MEIGFDAVLSPEEVVASLHLDPGEWERRRVEAVKREATGPDGQSAVLTDNVIVLRRTDTSAEVMILRFHDGNSADPQV